MYSILTQTTFYSVFLNSYDTQKKKKPEIIVIVHYCNIFLISCVYFFVFCIVVSCEKLHYFWKKHMNIWYPCSHSYEFFVCMFTEAYFGYNLTSVQL